MNQFIDDHGTYLVLAIMCLLTATIIYTTLPIKRYRPKIVKVIFVCYLCKGNGEAKNDPLFDCCPCEGTGVISFSIRIGHSIFDDCSSRLGYRASLNHFQAKRFMGFMPASVKERYE